MKNLCKRGYKFKMPSLKKKLMMLKIKLKEIIVK